MDKKARMALAALLVTSMMMTPVHAEDLQKLNTHLELVDKYAAGGYYDKADEHIAAALELVTPETNAELMGNLYLKRGSIYLETKEYDKALEALDKALEIVPTLSDALLYKAQVYIDSGMNDKAGEMLEAYVAATGDTSVYNLLAQIYEANGDTEKALEAFQSYVGAGEESTPEDAYQLAVYRMSLGMYAEAQEGLKGLLEDETYGLPAKYNLALCLMNSKDYENALPYLAACIEAEAGYDGMYYNRAVCAMMLDRYEEAAADFAKSCETESYAQDALYNQAICTMSLEKNLEAADLFTKYLETYPDAEQRSTVIYYRGVCRLSGGDYENAVTDFTDRITADDTDYDSTFYRGLSYLQLGKLSEASSDFGVCIRHADADGKNRAKYYRALVYEAQGKYDQAIRDLTQCIDAQYDLFNSYQARARIYQEKGDEEKYLADLEESLKY